MFSSHIGLHRYKRLNVCVNDTSETFQQIIEQVLHGLDGVKNISGDIIIVSRNDAEHEKYVRACLERLMKKGFTLNRNKYKIFQSSVEFSAAFLMNMVFYQIPRK